MARRDIDTSKAKCDVCSKPYQGDDAVYSIADKRDEEIEDRDVLVSFRHWDCYTPIDKVFDSLRDKAKEAERLLDKLRGKF